MFAFVLQIAGFVLAVIFLCLDKKIMYGLGFGVHVIGDIIFVIQNGLPKVSFLDSFESAVKIAPWLQFVGLMVCFGGLLFSNHSLSHLVCYLGLGLSFAGFVYDKIYP